MGFLILRSEVEASLIPDRQAAKDRLGCDFESVPTHGRAAGHRFNTAHVGSPIYKVWLSSDLAAWEQRHVITGELKSKVDRVWDAFWSGGVSNPLEVIQQITYLLFIRRLDDLNTLAEKKANRTGKAEGILFLPDQQDLRWSVFKNDDRPTPQLLSRVVDTLDDVPMADRDTTGDLYMSEGHTPVSACGVAKTR